MELRWMQRELHCLGVLQFLLFLPLQLRLLLPLSVVF
jgi:hypothetical protein